jgi:energy-coupling factor transport system ATP-binding protein
MIRLEGVRLRNLEIASLEIPPKITSVIGPNGSGKSTLLKICAGILLPESGTVTVDGAAPRDCEVGWVNEFPDRNIVFETAFEEIASPLRFRHISCDLIKDRVVAVLDMLDISDLASRSVQELSGGEKVLVSLGASLVMRPQILVLDECDSHLDGSRAEEIGRIVRESGVPYVIRSTQQTDTVLRDDHCIFLEQGRVCSSGTPDRVFAALAGTPFYPISRRCLP